MPFGPLLATKLYVPPTRPDSSTRLRTSLVPRPRLIERLNEGLHRTSGLTLVSAPAGFGKTTLLSSWLYQLAEEKGSSARPGLVEGGAEVNFSSAPPHPCPPAQFAWLSLDEADNDPTRFLSYFIAALQQIDPNIGQTVQGMLHAMQPQPPPIENLMTALINEISASFTNARCVFILDDYHLIQAQSIHNALTFLLDHLPPHTGPGGQCQGMHLVIATRSDPPLPLARLRGRGQLTELRSGDLRFALDEANAFLNQVLGLELPADDVAALASRTEGWIAGLQMAAVSMQGRKDIASFVRAFTGSHRFILDYLVEEVLHRQPESVQAFLLQTSILDRLTGPLCDAVTLGRAAEPRESAAASPRAGRAGQDDSQSMLDRIERANLFIVPLDDERRWYRYHHLFADLLRNQLSRKQPKLLPTLHLRASEWFEQEAMIPEAVHHAAMAKDFDRAATLIESSASTLLNESRPATLLSLMAKLPEKSVVARPWLCVYGAWAYFLTWQFDAVEPLLHSAEMRLAQVTEVQPPETWVDNARIRGRMITLRAFMAQGQGDLPGAIELSNEALKYLDEDDHQLRSVLEQNLGNICLISGQLASARRHLNRSATAGRAAGNFFAALGAVSRLAELETIQGHLHEAAKTYRQAIQLGTQWGGGQPLPGTSRAHVGLAQVLYEWNDLDEAAHHLKQGMHLSEQCGEQEVVLEGYLTLARLRQAQCQANAATEALERAEALAPGDNRILDAGHVSSWQVRISLAQGDLTAARRWADSKEPALSLSDVPDIRFEVPCLTLVRVRIAEGEVKEAMRLLVRLLQTAEAEGRVGRVIEILVLRGLAFSQTPASRVGPLGGDGEDMAQAMTCLERALSLAELEGYVRVFVDEGRAMAELLRHAASRGILPEYVAKLLAAFDVSESKTHPPTQPLVEPLSQRELEVLRLLTTGFSTPEVAQELFIAVSTVRSHVKSIYSKLNVHKRNDAIQRAKELKLL
jgi:LuxR family maltose regulon positive regulatory protein